MKKHLSEHVLYYLSLLSIQVTGTILFIFVSPNPPLQMMISILTSACYTALALTHHKVSHTLTAKIVVEYLLMAAVGMVLMLIYLR